MNIAHNFKTFIESKLFTKRNINLQIETNDKIRLQIHGGWAIESAKIHVRASLIKKFFRNAL